MVEMGKAGWDFFTLLLGGEERISLMFFPMSSKPTQSTASPDLDPQLLSHRVSENTRKQADTPLLYGAIQGLRPISQLWRVHRGGGHGKPPKTHVLSPSESTH